VVVLFSIRKTKKKTQSLVVVVTIMHENLDFHRNKIFNTILLSILLKLFRGLLHVSEVKSVRRYISLRLERVYMWRPK